MSNDNLHFSSKQELIIKLREILKQYEEEIKSGIFFNLKDAKSPLDILGVLDVLKFKIQKWRNTNIFYYKGFLFDQDPLSDRS